MKFILHASAPFSVTVTMRDVRSAAFNGTGRRGHGPRMDAGGGGAAGAGGLAGQRGRKRAERRREGGKGTRGGRFHTSLICSHLQNTLSVNTNGSLV